MVKKTDFYMYCMSRSVSETFRHDMRAASIEECGEKIKEYFESLGLPYNVEVWNGNPNESGDTYRFRVTLKDADGTSVTVATRAYNLESRMIINTKFSAEQVQNLMDGARQHYVLVVAPDKSTADRLASELFARDDVIAAETGSVDDARRLQNPFCRLALREQDPIIYDKPSAKARVKPAEKSRRRVAKEIDVYQR